MGVRRTPVKIELDGKERTLKFDLNALCLFEETAKQGITEALRQRSMSAIRALIWAGLIHEDPMLTIDDVGKMEFRSLQDIVVKVVSALSTDQPAEPRPTEAPEQQNGSTGGRSGASDGTTSDSLIPISGV